MARFDFYCTAGPVGFIACIFSVFRRFPCLPFNSCSKYLNTNVMRRDVPLVVRLRNNSAICDLFPKMGCYQIDMQKEIKKIRISNLQKFTEAIAMAICEDVSDVSLKIIEM